LDDEFKNKVAVVTGAGGGIGLAVALELSRLGAHVAAADIKAPVAALPDTISFTAVDLRNADQVAGWVNGIGERHGRIDQLVNCAGVCLFEQDGSVLETDPSVFDLTFDVNLSGAIRVIRAVVPHMRAAGGGSMVHIASVVGLRNMENIQAGGPADAYQLSKAAVVSLSRSLAMQLAPERIRSNTICPGAVATPMTAEIYAQEARVAAMSARTPLGRIGQPQDVASAVAFLLSDRASFITGIDLPVDGGILAKL
jgi:NAD(P)-dependent dehydrogenase (short-subunit alcohol dehydrogenase family)